MTHREKRKLLEPVLQGQLDNELNNITIKHICLYYDEFEFSVHTDFTVLYFKRGGVLCSFFDLDYISVEEICELVRLH